MNSVINRESLNTNILCLYVFMSFSGFYILLMIAQGLGFTETRIVSISFRILVGVLSVFLLILNLKNLKQLHLSSIAFFVIYLLNIVFTVVDSGHFYLSYFEWFFYFISFVVLPYLSIAIINGKNIDWDRVFLFFLLSIIFFSALSIFLYGKYFGVVQRITSGVVDDAALNPLILSYTASLGIGVISSYLMFNKPSGKVFLLSLLAILLSFVPFFLGASRGSVFALILPFFFILMMRLNKKSSLRILIILFVMAVIMFLVDLYFSSGLFERFFNIKKDVESGSSSASRLGIWSMAWDAFSYNPIFGTVSVPDLEIYPHNIYLEALQTVGVFGFIPFSLLLSIAFIYSYRIVLKFPEFSWVVVIFCQAAINGMFSGALYSSVRFWLSMALLLCLSKALSTTRKSN